jgi:hypothetical protein
MCVSQAIGLYIYILLNFMAFELKDNLICTCIWLFVEKFFLVNHVTCGITLECPENNTF